MLGIGGIDDDVFIWLVAGLGALMVGSLVRTGRSLSWETINASSSTLTHEKFLQNAEVSSKDGRVFGLSIIQKQAILGNGHHIDGFRLRNLVFGVKLWVFAEDSIPYQIYHHFLIIPLITSKNKMKRCKVVWDYSQVSCRSHDIT